MSSATVHVGVSQKPITTVSSITMQTAIVRETLRDSRDMMLLSLAGGCPAVAEFERYRAAVIVERARAYDAANKQLARMGYLRVQIAPPEQSTWGCVVPARAQRAPSLPPPRALSLSHTHSLSLLPRRARRYIFRNPSDRAYLKFTRMDMVTFNILRLSLPADWVAQHDGFADATRTAPKPGTPFLLDSHAALALWLHWFAGHKVRVVAWGEPLGASSTNREDAASLPPPPPPLARRTTTTSAACSASRVARLARTWKTSSRSFFTRCARRLPLR